MLSGFIGAVFILSLVGVIAAQMDFGGNPAGFV